MGQLRSRRKRQVPLKRFVALHTHRSLLEVIESKRRELVHTRVGHLHALVLILLTLDPSVAFIPSVRHTITGSWCPTVSPRSACIGHGSPMMRDSANLDGAEESQPEVAPDRSPLPAPQFACCGLAASPSRELLVIGTAHTPCRSAEEVSAIIRSAKPDVVVIELDQERLETLLGDTGDRRFGEDFAAAVEAATSVGAPIILGDAKARDTVASIGMPGPIIDGARLARGFQLAVNRLRQASLSALRMKPVSILGTLRDDPGKLVPLLGGIWFAVLPSFVTPVALLPSSSSEAQAYVTMASYAALIGLILLSARVFDVVLLSRDEILAKSALRGLELAEGLRSGELLRRRYSFSTDPAMLADCSVPEQDMLPFFTLRRPLRKGETRGLNLFEPRWLCLLDSLAARNTANGDVDTLPAPEQLLNATFGCVFAANRYYAPVEAGDGWAGDGKSERVADVILRPVARRARIISAKESQRPVSGARRLEIRIVGEEPLRLDSASLAPTDGGYLAGKVTPCTEAEYDAALAPNSAASGSSTGKDGGIARAVAVVGLLHANGVLDRSIECELKDKFALARWLEEESADWVGY